MKGIQHNSDDSLHSSRPIALQDFHSFMSLSKGEEEKHQHQRNFQSKPDSMDSHNSKPLVHMMNKFKPTT